ncbi:MAG: 4-alpha-glucanotransferase [Xanthobacteraceae bacterium]|nr:4-alpha-glucanotransferase [Xanthobacteraceae bacterium]
MILSPKPDEIADELAERMGIESEFVSATGETIATSAETKRKLLNAMGIAVDNEEVARASREGLDLAAWEKALPPVKVLRTADSAPSLELVLRTGAGECTGVLSLEDGTRRQFEFDFSSLELIGSKELQGVVHERRKLLLEPGLPCGYHTFELAGFGSRTNLIVSPGSCWLPPKIQQGGRLWGLAIQLYLLRSNRNWGIGDFTDLNTLVEIIARRGGDVIGLNPLHALFPDEPEHASPYAPATRLLLNPLNIDVEAVPELARCERVKAKLGSEQIRQALETCRAEQLVDYTRISALKFDILRDLFEACRNEPGGPRWTAFLRFKLERGEVLARNVLFIALRQHFAGQDKAQADWHNWPQPFRDPNSESAVRFADKHKQELDFLGWLQWVAEQQLAAVASTAKTSDMQIGLYRDLAVGADAAGAETWASAGAIINDAFVGAPPDIYNPAGQNWGLPPFNPRALQDEGYHSFIELIRANMRHAGGLRIDHAMALQHLYWVPAGEDPSAGAYVRYPMEDLISILALESHRHHCLVVGEDLGTVPKGFRERMAAANILSYRVLIFERDEDTSDFLPPNSYPRLALAVFASHDLPTLWGWWEGRDIELRQRLNLLPEADGARLRSERADDRARLVKACRDAGFLEDAAEHDFTSLHRAVHAFLASTNSALSIAQLDDLTGEVDPVNIPATTNEYPNWRRRFSVDLDTLASDPAFDRILRSLDDARRAETGSNEGADDE